MSHSCRSPASAARCKESMVPVFLSVPNTGLHQPQEQTACAPPSAASSTVTWWSIRPVSQVDDGAARRLAHAVDDLDPGAHEPRQAVKVRCLGAGDDVVGPGQARRFRDTRKCPEGGGYGGRLAGFGLDQNVGRDHVTPHQPSYRYLTTMPRRGPGRPEPWPAVPSSGRLPARTQRGYSNGIPARVTRGGSIRSGGPR